MSVLSPRIRPAPARAGTRRVCEWWDGGDNGEPEFIFPDGSPASHYFVQSLDWDGCLTPDDPRADRNPKYRQWEEGWYPVDETS